MTSSSETRLRRGRHAFGPEAAALFDADPHRPGSVDAMLLDSQVPLTPDMRAGLSQAPAGPAPYHEGSRPGLERIVRDVVGAAFHPVPKAVALARFCAGIQARYERGEERAERVLCGGAEEEIIASGLPLAADLARVLCALAQVSGMHARLVFLAREQPWERHTVTEICLGGLAGDWCVFDGFSGRFYSRVKHGYASAWDLHTHPASVDLHPDHGRQPYVDGAFYAHAAIATYDLNDSARFAYPRDPVPDEMVARLRAGRGA
jgi:hypothetical protein